MENNPLSTSTTTLNDAVPVATSTVVNFLESVNGLGDLFLYAVPTAFIIWAGKTAMSYYRDNSSKDAELNDSFDREIYSKAIVPLYLGLNNELASSEDLGEELTRVEYEAAKAQLLQQYDYSTIADVLDFSEVTDHIEKGHSKKRKIKSIRKFNKKILLAVMVNSFISIVSLGVYYFGFYVNVTGWIYTGTVIFDFLLLLIFFMTTNQIDSLSK